MQDWITDTLHTPLFDSSFAASVKSSDTSSGQSAAAITDSLVNSQSPRLIDINETQRLAELEFYLPLHALHQDAFNQLIESHGFEARTPYQFGQLTGMLKGFIDLTLQGADGRYWVLDYKSNWLGPDDSAYSAPAMQQALLVP